MGGFTKRLERGGLLDAKGAPVASSVVAICIPCHDTVDALFAHDLAVMMTYSTAMHPERLMTIAVHQASCLPMQREELAVNALENGATHLLWLDSDMRFPPDTLERLLAHDVAVVGANYSTRAVPSHFVAHALPDESGGRHWLKTTPASTGLEAARALGFGVCLVKAEVIRAIPAPRFMVGYHPDSAMFQGEDVYFCDAATKQGFSVYVDHDLSHEVSHSGRFEYRTDHALVSERVQQQQRSADS